MLHLASQQAVFSLNYGESAEFEQNPPKIEPEVIALKVPCRGIDADGFTISIKNTSKERLTYKMKGTKQDKFLISPTMGFVGPKSTCKIECQPKVIDSADGFNRFDNLSVIVAPAPKGDLWDAKSIWKAGSEMEPKQTKTYKIKLLVEEVKGQASATAESSTDSGESSGEE